jgi:hypothetical protein
VPISIAINLMDKLEKLINIVRSLKEEGGMVVGSGGFTSSADPKGPVAGYDNLLDGRSKIMRRLPVAYRKNIQKTKSKKK